MRGSTNVVKGRIEEATGVLTGNDKLRVRGQADQVVGRVEQAAEKDVRKARGIARKIVNKAVNIAQKAVNKARNSGLRASPAKV